MSHDFDPVRKRWLASDRIGRLLDGWDPDSRNLWGQVNHANWYVASCGEATLLGLEREARPTLEKVLAWMEGQPTPEFADERTYVTWFQQARWFAILGIARWLVHGDPAEDCFRRSIRSFCSSYEKLRDIDPPRVTSDLRYAASWITAVALNANWPDAGLDLYALSGLKGPGSTDGPARAFGVWACRSLADGGHRNPAFVSRGAAMLRKNLGGRYGMIWVEIGPLMWLKTIYFDSRLAATPVEAIAKAYDALDIPLPDFVLI